MYVFPCEFMPITCVWRCLGRPERIGSSGGVTHSCVQPDVSGGNWY